MRKPRSDSALANLQPQQRDALADWLLDGMSYAAAKEKLHMDFAVETSESALGGFYQQFCAPLRLRRAADAADALPTSSGGLMANWDEASVALVKQLYFEMLAAPTSNPESLFFLASQIAGIEKGKLEREKLAFNRLKHEETTRIKNETLALSREKFQRETCELFLKWEADAKAKAIANSPVSHAEKIAQLRQTFFADVDALEKSGEVLIPE